MINNCRISITKFYGNVYYWIIFVWDERRFIVIFVRLVNLFSHKCTERLHAFLGETAKGEYPLECVRTMANICKEAEAAIWHTQIFHDLSSKALPPIDATHAVAVASVEASVKCLATAIIVITTSGRSAHLCAKYRPRCPIIAVTRFHQVARQAHLYRGILPLYYEGITKKKTLFILNHF